MPILFYVACVIVFLLTLLFTARTRIKQKYNKYIRIRNEQCINGAQVAQHIIAHEKLDISLAQNKEDLCDAYYPKRKMLLMSSKVCDNESIASVAIVCHELGHATQHRDRTFLWNINQFLSKLTRLTNKFIIPLFIFGLICHATRWPNEMAGTYMCMTSAGLFIAHALVKLLLIPLEFNASKRAVKLIEKYKLLSKKEIRKSKSILNTAGQTYIVALFDEIIGFFRKILRKIFR